MKRLILSWGKCLVIIFASFVVVFIMLEVKDDMKHHSEVWRGNASFVSWTKQGKLPAMRLNCEGREAITTDGDLIIRYATKPGPIPCVLYESGDARAIETKS